MERVVVTIWSLSCAPNLYVSVSGLHLEDWLKWDSGILSRADLSSGLLAALLIVLHRCKLNSLGSSQLLSYVANWDPNLEKVARKIVLLLLLSSSRQSQRSQHEQQDGENERERALGNNREWPLNEMIELILLPPKFASWCKQFAFPTPTWIFRMRAIC